MKRISAITMAVATLLIAGAAHAERSPGEEVQAPRGQEIQAPRGEQIVMPRD